MKITDIIKIATLEQAEAHQKKHGFPPIQKVMDFVEAGQTAQKAVDKIIKGARTPNKTETEFGVLLAAQKTKFEIIRYEFEGIRLKWGVDERTGEAMYYKPDWFVVVCNAHDWDGVMTDWRQLVKFRCIEVKGAKIWDRDIVRFKGARAAWPEFEFEMWQKREGIWKRIH